MKTTPPMVTLSLLAALSLTGCHLSETQMVPLPGSAHPAYSITDLGAGMPSAINNRGQVAGMYAAGVFPNSKRFPYFHGCLWGKGKRTDMPTLGGWYSNAGKITDGGQVIGSAAVPGQDTHGLPLNHGCVWDGVKLTDLEADPRFRGTGALHITKSGAVYAISPTQGPQKQFHLWLYPSGFGPGVRRDVGVIGDPKIKPLFINDHGMVIGTWKTGKKRSATDTVGVQRAFVCHRGDEKWQDMGTLGGLGSEPTGLNNAGQVIGTSDLVDDPASPRARTHAFLWQNGTMKDLGTLPGGYFSHPYAINSKGQVVGFSNFNGGDVGFRPVLWERGQFKDLSVLIPSGTRWCNMAGAAGINDKGQIVGGGAVTDDQPEKGTYQGHAYLLTPR